MFQIEVHSRIYQIVQIFNKFGIWRNEDGVIWKWVYLMYHVCFVISMIAGGILSDDKDESIYLIAAGITNLVVLIKLAHILWKKEEITALIADIGNHFVEENEEFRQINGKVQSLMEFSSYFMLMSIGACSALNIIYLPVFTSEKSLPVNIWFPLDWKNNEFVYWIAYAFVSTALMISLITTLFNVIIWYLMMNCTSKYQILGNRLKNIGSTKLTVKKRKISEAEKQKLFLEELIAHIKAHSNIREVIDRLKSCFTNLFFAQISTSATCICGSVYLLAFTNLQENLVQTAINVVIMLYNTFDIFMVMYFGNEIKLSSDHLSYCLFQSNWIEQTESCKKSIIILTEVLKQPHELVICKLYPLTLETFTSKLNLAYSMFNILQNLN